MNGYCGAFLQPTHMLSNFDNFLGTFLDNLLSEDLTILVVTCTMLECNLCISYLCYLK